ncbi:MAG: diphthine synthase [Candidatus Aenigmarchaeota archaeon]|nr:diphthine synthase [Candidatus Aenigmarchaeota archaeon]
MGKLSLVGLGLYDEKDLTIRGIEEAKNADEVFIDTYTGIWNGDLKKLEKIIGKKIQPLARKDLEENSSKLLQNVKKKKIAILVQGDPLVATTHSALILEARKMKIKTHVIHNSSIYSAVAESGLHLSRFGATVTIPFIERTGGKLPYSVYETIKMNKENGFHTLCLLDILIEEKKFMTVQEAAKILVDLENQQNMDVIKLNDEILAAANIGSSKSFFVKKKVSEFLKFKSSELPAVLIIPGKLHFSEKELLFP